MKLIAVYTEQASKLLEHISADSKALIGQLTESVKGLSMPPILSTTILENAITDEIKEKGRGLITKIRISQAFDILSIDSSLMQNEAHLDLLRVLVSGGFLAIEDIKSRTKMLFPSIQTCIAGDSIEHHDWIRFFSQGCGALCKTWLHTIQLIMKHSNGCEFSESAMYSIVNHCISRLLPGDDACGFDLAQQFFASKTYTKDGTSISIRDVYENLMTLKENVNYSRSLFGAEDAGKPSCLRIEVHQGISSYPLRLDWIYSPIAEYLERQSKQLDNDNVALKSFAILSFAREMEDSSALISPANKLANMMHIFLLCDSNGDELFRDSAMQGILDWGLRKYCINGGCNLENAFSLLKAGQIATQSRFYELYQELVNQYLAVSFGDGVFSNYLAIALTMDYPVDYRLYFWTAMGPMVRSIFWTEKDLPGQNVKKYIEPIETNAELLDMYRHALNSGAVSAKVNPVLFKIASHHLRK